MIITIHLLISSFSYSTIPPDIDPRLCLIQYSKLLIFFPTVQIPVFGFLGEFRILASALAIILTIFL